MSVTKCALFPSASRINKYVLCGSAMLCLFAAKSSAVETLAQFENPPVLHAKDLAPAPLLSGKGFQVDDAVPTDGLTAVFTIRSDVGTFRADGVEMLKIRVAEIPAIQELDQTSKTKVFAQSLAKNGMRPVTAAGQMVLHPIDTVKGIPGGVGRFFGRVGLGAKRIKQAATEPEEASAAEKAGEVTTRTAQTTRDIFGYEQERRELAKKLDVDPYTTNPILAQQLDEFAVVAFRAHVVVTTSMSVFIPGSIAITGTRMISAWVWDTPKADLIVQNQKKLEKINVPADTIKAFMRNPAFPLSVRTDFVEDLTHLSGVPGTTDVVALAGTANSEDQARFLADTVAMLASYHQTRTPLVQITARGTVVGRDHAGAIVVPAPVDYASWNKRTAYFANRSDLVAPKRSVWLSGQISPLARRNFEALDWGINERTQS